MRIADAVLKYAKAWAGGIGAALTAGASVVDSVPDGVTFAGAALTAFAVYIIPNKKP